MLFGLSFLLDPQPAIYEDGDKVPVTVGELMSHSFLLPIDYNFQNVLCGANKKVSQSDPMNNFFGRTQQPSVIQIEMGKDQEYIPLCSGEVSHEEKMLLAYLIERRYRIPLFIDSLPSLVMYERDANNTRKYTSSYILGFVAKQTAEPPLQPGLHYLINHLDINIFTNNKSIVQVYIDSKSRSHTPEINISIPNPIENLSSTYYTYSVHFHHTDEHPDRRYSLFIEKHNNPHIFSALHPLTCFCICCLVILIGVAILAISIKRDFRINPDEQTLEQQAEQSGWKLVHGDVFRVPTNPRKITIVMSGGTQLLFTVITISLLGVVGLFSPANPGQIILFTLLMAVAGSFLSGITSVWTSKQCGDFLWKEFIMKTCYSAYAPIVGSYLILDLVFYSVDSTASVPLIMIVTIAAIVCGASFPLHYWGAVIGYKIPSYTPNCNTNAIMREIPDQPFWAQQKFLIFVTSFAGFAALSTFVVVIVASVFTEYAIFHLFQCILLAFVGVVLSAALVSISAVYIQLKNENYKWWQTAFIAPASAAIYIFVFSVLLFMFWQSSGDLITIVIFSIGSFIVSTIIAFIMGSVGFIAAYVFVAKLYGSLEI